MLPFFMLQNAVCVKKNDTEQILFKGDCLTFHLQNTEKFSCSEVLNAQPVLRECFIQVYRKCMVNLCKITNVRKHEIHGRIAFSERYGQNNTAQLNNCRTGVSLYHPTCFSLFN